MNEQLFHIGVKWLLKNAQGKYLCVQSSKWYYDIPGGRIIENETWQEALYRELEEELSLWSNSYTLEPVSIALPTNRILQKEPFSIRLFILIGQCLINQEIEIVLNHENKLYSWETARDLYEKVDILQSIPFETLFE